MKKYIYPAIFEFATDGITVRFPDLPGVITEGDTIEQAHEMAVEALGEYIELALEGKEQLYEPTHIKDIKLISDAEQKALIAVDMNQWLKKYSQASIRKNVSIPIWLNEKVQEYDVNVSAVLKSALIDYIAKIEK